MNTKDEQSVDEQDIVETLTPKPALDQWKFYAQTTLNTSNRRLKNNRFYIRILLGLLAAVGAGRELGVVNPAGMFLAGLVGFFMCVLWFQHIKSYKQLNSGKYTVLSEIADDLPYAPFELEWDKLDEGKNRKKYITHTSVEKWWPRVLGYPFAIMTLHGGTELLRIQNLYTESAIAISLIWISYFASIYLGHPIFEKINDKAREIKNN